MNSPATYTFTARDRVRVVPPSVQGGTWNVEFRYPWTTETVTLHEVSEATARYKARVLRAGYCAMLSEISKGMDKREAATA